jgi:purine nucleosidase
MDQQLVGSKRLRTGVFSALVIGGFLAATGCAPGAGGDDDGALGTQANAVVSGDRDDDGHRGGHHRRPRPVIFDHDADFDDMAALAYLGRLHKAGEIDLRLVTVTSAGAGLPGRGIRNTRCVLERLGLSHIPVADSRTVGPNTFPAILRSTFDAVLGQVTPGCTASEDPSAVPAERAIADEIERSHERVTLIVTGPATNIAAAMRLGHSWHASRLADGVSRAYMLGGAIDVPGGLCCGLESTFDYTQTFNLWADPPAMQQMLDGFHEGQVTLVSAEATNHVPIRLSFIDRLRAEAVTPEAVFVRDLGTNPTILFSVMGGLSIYWWDPLDGVAATESGIVQYDFRRVRIVQTGPSSGRTLEVGRGECGGTWVQHATNADQTGFENAFLEGLNQPVP